MNTALAMVELLGCGLIALGTVFCLSAAVGVVRFPDVYTRLHAGTKCLTAGALLVLAGVAVLEGSWSISGRVLLVALFFLATNPIAAHAVARASYRQSDSHPTIRLDELRGAFPGGLCADWSAFRPLCDDSTSGPQGEPSDPPPSGRTGPVNGSRGEAPGGPESMGE